MILQLLRKLASCKLLTVAVTWIVFVIISIHHYAKGASYSELKGEMGLVDPYQIDQEAINLVDIENMTTCDCPRVHYPVCANNGETYINHCVLRCTGDSEFLRFGPCVMYRRMDNVAVFPIRIPTKWKMSKNHSIIEIDDRVDAYVIEIPIQN
ncbi:uncharacterized protein LOC118279346 [Spodoptera frugiperda]|uniref:Uncharacterized protein LOC118279346 n=1 Tax=Spodoptera frugiperda TaxID=7108 RepID=A0A9R0ES31_SPOFR|nr:uncharacterized protein LOC118279346 [Spodoptera frugiperda]